VARRAAALELDAPPVRVQALEAVYACHAPGLRRRCLQLTRDADAADELMQEVFVRFIERFPRPPMEMNVGAYLNAMARNVQWNQLRDDHEVPDGDLAASAQADDDLETDPERAALLVEQRSRVQRCAALLTGRQRRALTLRDIEGHSYAEIGSELGIATDAVAQVIFRARTRLRGALRRAEIDLDELPASCREMIKPLSDYLDGRAALHAPEIEDHLAGCASCRQTLALFEEAGSRLRGFAPFVPLVALASRLRRGTARHAARVGELAQGNAVTSSRIGGGVAAAAAAGVLALAGGGVVAYQLTSSPGQASAASAVSSIRRTHAPGLAQAVGGRVTPPVAQPAAARPPGSAHLAVASIAAVVPRRHVLRIPQPPASPVVTAPGTAPSPATPVATPAVGGRVTPVVTVPSTPRVTAPTVTAPTVTAPTVTIPTVRIPKITVPAIVPPPITLPVGTKPVITTPPVTVPGVTTPTVPNVPAVPVVPVPALPLGASASFGVLAGAGITNTGLSAITGDIGAFPTVAITGLASLTIGGTNQAGTAVTQQAKADLATAYAASAGKASTATISGDIGGRTLGPGIYDAASSIGLTGTLTLDGHGDPNAVFILRAGSTLITASASQVALVNGARSCNVFWQVGSSATLGTGSTFRGSILALTSITVTTGVTIDGRVLARNGAVTLDSDSITRSGQC
jgi:RNA polymerase sigma factor (sigma-70 family)